VKKTPPHNTKPSTDPNAQVLTTVGTKTTWFGTPAILLYVGDPVPANTPDKTLIFRRTA